MLYNGRPVKNIYSLEEKFHEHGKYKYKETQFTAANRRAVLEWQQHATDNHYKLTFLLLPDPRYLGSTDFYSELREFLEAHGIDYIDLMEEFRAMGVGVDAFSWQYDGHPSPKGNRLIADILLRRLEDRGATRSSGGRERHTRARHEQRAEIDWQSFDDRHSWLPRRDGGAIVVTGLVAPTLNKLWRRC